MTNREASPGSVPFTRPAMLQRLSEHSGAWDLVIVGGGATGVGVAVDAASRGYSVLLLERSDFGKGTSSRSTKLVHGGVRYLEQGNIPLVMEALKERGMLRENAPHLVSDLAFVVPNYDWWEAPFYGVGLKLYNLLAGKYGFGPSQILSREETLQRLPTIKTEGLRGGVVYYDGQFDDARLLINIAQTAAEQGAVVLNYIEVTGVLKDAEGVVAGVTARDVETGREFRAAAKCVINATGPFCDSVRRLADPAVESIIKPSQGIHLVFDRSFLAGNSAIMVPHTTDGRVMFAIPWHGHTVVGTTDTPIDAAVEEPLPLEQEIEFVLANAQRYLDKAPTRADVLSVFTGIRPLVRAGGTSNTATLSRDHTIQIDPSGLLTITGGKWTTYRHMAEDCVDHAATLARLPDRPCITKTLRIHGYHPKTSGPLHVYGSDAENVRGLGLPDQLHPDLPYIAAEVIWAVRHEMARTVEDVLARRLRALFLHTAAAVAMAPQVARLMGSELGWDEGVRDAQLSAFHAVAKAYSLEGVTG